MPNDPPSSSWRERIRNLVAAGVLIVSVGAGAALSSGSTEQADVVRVASFNIQVFGQTKAKNQAIMDVLGRVARLFDVMAVEEVRDASGQVASRFLARINQNADATYAMI